VNSSSCNIVFFPAFAALQNPAPEVRRKNIRPHNGGYVRKRVEKKPVLKQGRKCKQPVGNKLKKFSFFRFLFLGMCAFVSKSAGQTSRKQRNSGSKVRDEFS